jgi:thiamine pyrophosphate-dependent acetolactate synthase large subunit-like protein
MKKIINNSDLKCLTSQPRLWTVQDIEEVIVYLVRNKTTKEIRRWQDLNYQQTTTAFKAQRTEALENLQMMANIYAEVVNRKEFPR